MGIFNKAQKNESASAQKNWYSDRYQSAVVQRNFLALLVLLTLACIVVAVFTVVQVTTSKSIEPFVIEIEERTGITNVIRPLLKEQFAYDEALRKYFLWKYVNAREGYDYYSFEHEYFTVVRLLSSATVYSEFKRIVAISNESSPIRLGAVSRRFIKIKSISYLETPKNSQGFVAQVRFTQLTGATRAETREENKVATLAFDFIDMNLTREERAINPLGFQILSYRVDDETI